MRGIRAGLEGVVDMRKPWILAGLLAGLMCTSDAIAQHQQPNQQPATAPSPTAPTGELALGAVQIPRAVTADGKPLPGGKYQIRLTAQEAKPDAVGTSGNLERWVEFLQGTTVKGREVVTIVPQSEIKMVVKDAPPPAGGSKVQMLKGNDYLRVWINKAGNHYLIHLPASGGEKTGL
jgi:hypothetical protein